jgi:sterol desaturase/sphingolipid hydroxylase (fatty acid hydroxylase superfamily)
MKKNPIPEILVPPDMEQLEIEEISETRRFPLKRLLAMTILTLSLLFTGGMGISTLITAEDFSEVIPYWIFTVLLLLPCCFSCYFFFSYFQPRLSNPYDEDSF